MAEGSSALHAGSPLTERIAETPPWSPLRLAVGLAAGLFALLLAVDGASGRLPLVFGDGTGNEDVAARLNFRIAVVMILIVAYLPAAYAAGVQGARRAVEGMRPFLHADEAGARLVASVGRFDPVVLRRAGIAGVAYGLLIPFWIDRTLGAWFVWDYPVEAVFQRALLPPLGWFAGRFIYSVWAESRRLSAIGRDQVRVDLLDLRAFAPLTRLGLRYALLVVGVVSILALYLYDSDKRGLFSVVLVASGVALAAAATALLLPLRGARDAIVAAKRHELDACDAALRRARAGGDAPPGAVADLVAWRGLVASVHEWPLDAPTLRRFLLSLGLPLGSWLGGALVEHIVDVILR